VSAATTKTQASQEHESKKFFSKKTMSDGSRYAGSIVNRLERILLFECCDYNELVVLWSDLIEYDARDKSGRALRLERWSDPTQVPNLKTLAVLPEAERKNFPDNFKLTLPGHALFAMTWFGSRYKSAFLTLLYTVLERTTNLAVLLKELTSIPVGTSLPIGIGPETLQLYRKVLQEFECLSKFCNVCHTPNATCLLCIAAEQDFGGRIDEQDTVLLETLLHMNANTILHVHPSMLLFSAKRKLGRSVSYLLYLVQKSAKVPVAVRFVNPAQSCLSLICQLGITDENVRIFMNDEQLLNRMLILERVTTDTCAQNILIDLMHANVASAMFRWLIPRLSYDVLNGYDNKGKNVLVNAIEMDKLVVIDALLFEPRHRVDFCARTLLIDDAKDTCLPHKPYVMSDVFPYQLLTPAQRKFRCAITNELEYTTKFQRGVSDPKRMQCVRVTLEEQCFPMVVITIILKQCFTTPIRFVTTSTNRNEHEDDKNKTAGVKRKREGTD